MVHLILLCLVQGIGEFLPISSSAHLYFLTHFGHYPVTALDIEVALHLGSLLALCVYLYRPLGRIIGDTFKSIFTFRVTPGFSMGIMIVIATLPAIIIGFLVKRYAVLPQTFFVIGLSSLVFGALLWIAEHINKQTQPKITLFRATMIGVAQALAFIPGASRFGVCLTAAGFFGVQRMAAVKFSFLLAIPTILGAVVLTGFDVIKNGHMQALIPLWPAVIGTFFVSLLVLGALTWYAKRYTFKPFAFYRIILGCFLIYWAYTHGFAQ
jgi:undecaprenyl-diphosphatase